MPDITLIIFLFLFNSLEIFGFYFATREEDDEQGQQILWWVKAVSKLYLGEYWTKPVCGCVVCMASLHSLFIWIPIYIIMPFTFMLIYTHMVWILALAGFNYLITSLRILEL